MLDQPVAIKIGQHVVEHGGVRVEHALFEALHFLYKSVVLGAMTGQAVEWIARFLQALFFVRKMVNNELRQLLHHGGRAGDVGDSALVVDQQIQTVHDREQPLMLLINRGVADRIQLGVPYKIRLVHCFVPHKPRMIDMQPLYREKGIMPSMLYCASAVSRRAGERRGMSSGRMKA